MDLWDAIKAIWWTQIVAQGIHIPMSCKYYEGMEKDMTETVNIPDGEYCAYCCGDCTYMDLNYKNDYGEAWCGKYEKYYSPSANAGSCSYFHFKEY